MTIILSSEELLNETLNEESLALKMQLKEQEKIEQLEKKPKTEGFSFDLGISI